MAAAGGGHAKVVALLLDNGADADKLSYVSILFVRLRTEEQNLVTRPIVDTDAENHCIVPGTRVSAR